MSKWGKIMARRNTSRIMGSRPLQALPWMGWLAAALPAAAAPQADEASPQLNAIGLEEIVVTARKREERLRDVPISITAFSSEQIENLRLQSLYDYAKFTPNVGYFTQGNSLQQKFTIRGVTNLGGQVNSLAVYVDEFNVTPGITSATYEQELLDLERIEVLRGPQGILFGRNVVGGALNITTRKPDADFGGQIGAEYGNFGTWSLRGTLNAPLVAERAAVRLTGISRSSDGYLKDVGPADNSNSYDVRGGRVALRLTPGESFTADLAVSLVDHEEGISALIPTGELYPVLLLLLQNPVAIDDGQGFFPANTDRIATDFPSKVTNDTTMVTGRLEWDLGGFSLVSVSGYIDNKGVESSDADYTAQDLAIDTNIQNLESYSTELRAQSQGGGNWNWLMGAIYARDENDASSLRFLKPAYTQLFRFGITGPRNVVDNFVSGEVKSYGVFGDLTWRNDADTLNLSLGARYSHDEIFQSLFDNSQNLFTGAPLNNRAAGDGTFHDVSPRFAAVYKITPDINLYATVSKGYKPGGFNYGSLQTPSLPRNFDKEEAWNYEVGMKAGFLERRLQANLSLFDMQWDDIQVRSGFVTPTLVRVQAVLNAAKASSTGGELELAALPADWLRLELNVGYNEATFDSFPNAVDAFGAPYDASGNTLPLVPKWSVGSAVQFDVPFGASTGGFARVEYIYRDLQYSTFDNLSLFDNVPTLGSYVPSYHVWNLRFGFEGDRYRVTAFVENAPDDTYIIGGRPTNYMSGNTVVVDPRRYGVRVSYDF